MAWALAQGTGNVSSSRDVSSTTTTTTTISSSSSRGGGADGTVGEAAMTGGHPPDDTSPHHRYASACTPEGPGLDSLQHDREDVANPKKPSTSDHPLSRGDPPLSRGDHPLSRGDPPLSRGDPPLSRGDHPLSRGDLSKSDHVIPRSSVLISQQNIVTDREPLYPRMDERVGVVGGSMLVGVAGPVGAPGGDSHDPDSAFLSSSSSGSSMDEERMKVLEKVFFLCVCLTGAM